MTQVALDELRRLQGITGEPSMAGGGCALCYGGRGHKTTNGENRKMEKLTVSLTVGVAASVRPPKARLMAAAIWREREGTGEVESEQTVTKPRYRGTYERGGIRRRSSTRRRWGSRRWSTYYRGDGDWSSDERRKGQRGGLGSGLIGGGATVDGRGAGALADSVAYLACAEDR